MKVSDRTACCDVELTISVHTLSAGVESRTRKLQIYTALLLSYAQGTSLLVLVSATSCQRGCREMSRVVQRSINHSSIIHFDQGRRSFLDRLHQPHKSAFLVRLSIRLDRLLSVTSLISSAYQTHDLASFSRQGDNIHSIIQSLTMDQRQRGTSKKSLVTVKQEKKPHLINKTSNNEQQCDTN